MIIHATMIRAGLEAAISNCKVTSEGAAFPDELYTNAAKYHGAANYNLMVRHLHDIAGGSVVTAPSIADLENPEVGPLVRKYMSTAQAWTASTGSACSTRSGTSPPTRSAAGSS